MLEYCKVILQKVSFNQFLFEKEFKKSIGYLLPHEVPSFMEWVQNNYADQYSDVINEMIKVIIK